MHRNPNIVIFFQKSNYIEKLGTGLIRIDSELEKAGLPKVELEINEYWFSIVFKRKRKVIDLIDKKNVIIDIKLNRKQKSILKFCISKEKSRKEIFEHIEMINSTNNNLRFLVTLLRHELVRMTEPEKPKSKNQKYYTTKFGKSQI